MPKKKKEKVSEKKETVTSEKEEKETKKKKMTPEEKKQYIIDNFSMYKFIIKIVACALLVVLGVLIIVDTYVTKKHFALMAVYFATAVIAIAFGIIRLVMLLRKKEMTREAKIVSVVEACIHIVVGLYLGFAGWLAYLYHSGSTDSDILINWAKFNDKTYAYFVAVLLYVRAVSYLWQRVLLKVEGTKFTFWLHIVCITLAVLFAAFGKNLDVKVVATIFAVISFICAALVGGEAGFGYGRYKKAIAPKKEETVEVKEEKPQVVTPTTEDNQDKEISDIDPNAIPKNDNNNDSPMVN